MKQAVFDEVWASRGVSRQLKSFWSELRSFLEERDHPVAIALTRDSSRAWRLEEMRELEEEMLDASPQSSRAGLMKCLYLAVGRWRRQTKTECPKPRRVVEPRRAKNPLRHDLAKNLRAHRRLRQALFAALQQAGRGSSEGEGGPETESNRTARVDHLALAIASAIIHLGLLHEDCVVATVVALANPQGSFLALNRWVALALSLPVRGVPNSEHRIWIPDPLTATLLLRVSPSAARTLLENARSKGKTDKEVRLFILRAISIRIANALGSDGSRRRKHSVRSVVRTCVRAAPRWLPFAIVAYQSRRFISHSLPPEVLARMDPTIQLLSNEYAGNSTAPLDMISAANLPESWAKESAGDRSADPDGGEPIDVDREPTWAPVLHGAMTGKQTGPIRRRLEALAERKDLPQIALRLAEFAALLATPRGSKTVRPATLRKYMSLLVRFLGPRFESNDNVGNVGAEDLYSDAIEDHRHSTAGRSLSSQQIFATLVLRFHGLLVEKYEAKPLEDIHGFVAGCMPVNANVLSIEDIHRVVDTLGQVPLIPPHQRLQAQLLLILGCLGLRRNEAYYLRVCDIDPGAPVYLLVRNTEQRRVKSANSIRRINLSALLPRPAEDQPDEGMRLLAFLPSSALDELLTLRWKRAQEAGSTARLFTSDGPESLSEDQLFDAIHRVMRDVLGDQKLRLHSARHSMSTWLTLSLLAGNLPVLASFLPSLHATRAMLRRCDVLRHDLYGSRSVSWCDLHLIANHIGHGSARMTIGHYCHSMFLAAAAWILQDEDLAETPKAVLAAASGIPVSTVYRRTIEGNEALPIFIFRKKRFAKEIEQYCKSKSQRKASRGRRRPNSDASWFEKAMAFVELAVDPALPRAEAIRRSGIETAAAIELLRVLASSNEESKKRRHGKKGH